MADIEGTLCEGPLKKPAISSLSEGVVSLKEINVKFSDSSSLRGNPKSSVTTLRTVLHAYIYVVYPYSQANNYRACLLHKRFQSEAFFTYLRAGFFVLSRS